MLLYVTLYFRGIFCCFSSKICVFIILISNSQSETGIVDKKLSVELHDAVFASESTSWIWASHKSDKHLSVH